MKRIEIEALLFQGARTVMVDGRTGRVSHSMISREAFDAIIRCWEFPSEEHWETAKTLIVSSRPVLTLEMARKELVPFKMEGPIPPDRMAFERILRFALR